MTSPTVVRFGMGGPHGTHPACGTYAYLVQDTEIDGRPISRIVPCCADATQLIRTEIQRITGIVIGDQP